MGGGVACNERGIEILRFLIFAPLVALLPACTSTPPLGGASSLTVVSGNLPPPTTADLVGEQQLYRIGSFDKLTIDVFGVEGLTAREVQVDSAGSVAFPLAGTIKAQGLTPAEVGELIASRLRGTYIRDPQVTVNLVDVQSQVLTVDGEVRQPGLYPVGANMTLERAIARAQGTTEYAKTDDVVVFRNVGTRRMAALYSLAAIRRGAYLDPTVYANDVIVVGDSKARRLFKNLLQVVPLLTTPLVVWLRNL